MYGILNSALLFYKKLVEYLEAYGLNTNPYDNFVVNIIIIDKQMTVTLYVNDLKLYHKDPDHITKFVCYISSIYGKDLKVKRGKVRDYLGMDIGFSEKIALKVSMIKYVKKTMDAFSE